jgi:hypothetical protein
MTARFDRKAIRFMAGVECLVLAMVLLVPLFFPVELMDAIGVPIVAGMTGVAVLFLYFSFRLLYRREKDDQDRPYVALGRESDTPLYGESRLESKTDAARSFYFSDGTGRHYRRGGGRL